MPRSLLVAVLLLAGLVARAAWGQEEEASLIESPRLPTDSIRKVGEETSLQGCILLEDEETIEFLEIVQRPGRRVSLRTYPIARDKIQPEHTVQVSDEEKQELLSWISQVRQREGIETGLLEAVELREQPGDSSTLYLYDGPWFTLESNANAETTRRCVVRIEQVFRAYRSVLRPRTTPASPLRVRLFGSMEGYNAYLAQQGIELSNPAFFDRRENLIVAGGELSLFAENLEEVRKHNGELQAHIDTRRAALPEKLRDLRIRLRALGYSESEISTEASTRENAELDELILLEQEIRRAERANSDGFNELSEQMFRRLYHEALHAYLENYVFPHELGEVPPWLNEGLALFFEGSLLEGERLRFDAPHAVALAQIEQDFEAGAPLPLRSVILANSENFHFHSINDQLASRYYAYAWGLTWYCFKVSQTSLTPSQAERSLTPPDEETTDDERIAGFEAMIGMPLADFEPQWRAAMREMW